jgi:hypothetical protein
MKNNLTACCTLATLAVFAVPQNARANAYAMADAQLDFTITATGHTRANALVPLGTWTWSSLSTSSESEAYWEMPPQSDSQSASGPTSASSTATAAPGNTAGGNTLLNNGSSSGSVASHSHSTVKLPQGTFATAENVASGSASFKIALPGPSTPTSSSYISSWDLVITPTVSSGLTIDFSTLPGVGGLFAGGYAHYQYNVVVNSANQGHQNVSVGDTIFADETNYGFTGAAGTTLPGIVRSQTWNGAAFVGAGYTPVIKLDWLTETGVTAGNSVPDGGASGLFFGAATAGLLFFRRKQT